MKAYHHIVVGIDFSPACLAGLSAAVRIASRHGTPVTAIHVADPKLAGVMKEAHKATDAEVFKRISESVQAFVASSDCGTQMVRVELEVGHPFLCLRAACKRHRADLLILGTRGTEHGRNQIGAVAAKCLRKIPADVLLVREGHSGAFKRVTACVDFSETSAKAVATAGALAVDENATLVGLFIYQSALALSMDYGGFMPGLPLGTDETAASWEKELDSFLERLLADAKSLIWQGKVIEQMNVREGIRRHVAESETDLVVLGTLGKTNLRTFLMGSTAERIVTHAHCSVLAVKPEGFVDPVEEGFARNAQAVAAAGRGHEASEGPCSCRTKDACIQSMTTAITSVKRNEKEATAFGR
jgi:universal stress protein E